jgi:hypothetical protein
MANINKSFNFRNGVQVDNDNFVVNPNGLVGIGTSIPTEFLDVHGTAKVTGLVTARNLAITGVSTFYSDVKVGSGITISASTGAVGASTFYGSAAGLTDIYAIAVDGWYVNTGNISTTSKVGIGTTLPYYSLQVGQNPSTGNGFTVDALTGNVKTTGIITANSFDGSGTSLTLLNATNIASGTLNNSRLPQSISITGIITAYSFSGFGTDITGINASNISNGTLNNSRLPQNITISGSITANSSILTSLTTTNINNSGIATLGIANASQLYVSGVTTSANGFVGNLSGNINSTGLSTFSGGIEGNVIGIASTARSLTGTPDITVGTVIATTINVGSGGTGFSALNSGRIGVGTALPSSEFQIRKSSGSLLEVISDSGQSRISIGQVTGVGNSTGVLRFGNTAKTFDIINRDTGNINTILHGGSSGVGTGRFAWVYGQDNTEKMSLTYDGKLGINQTNPINTLHVVGTSTVTGNAYFGNNVDIKGTLTAGTITFPSVISSSNLYVTTGISTFREIKIQNRLTTDIPSIGIGTNNPITDIDARTSSVLIQKVGINTNVFNNNQSLSLIGGATFDSVGIGTTNPVQTIGFSVYDTNIIIDNSPIQFSSTSILTDNNCSVGIGTSVPLSTIDFSYCGIGIFRYMVTPKVTTSIRNTFINTLGVGTVQGAIIYNTTTFRHQGYGSTDGGVTFKWQDLY